MPDHVNLPASSTSCVLGLKLLRYTRMQSSHVTHVFYIQTRISICYLLAAWFEGDVLSAAPGLCHESLNRCVAFAAALAPVACEGSRVACDHCATARLPNNPTVSSAMMCHDFITVSFLILGSQSVQNDQKISEVIGCQNDKVQPANVELGHLTAPSRRQLPPQVAWNSGWCPYFANMIGIGSYGLTEFDCVQDGSAHITSS